ncbi:CDP-glycerol glycerophosphotransferase family protein, partial [Staphylococcus aureus]|uniref:CDP-glycerol glycerophosphotransferase family protein n=1 Tax=Staphylococcus aureus TaxID=1280 RepID=UPI0037DA6350
MPQASYQFNLNFHIQPFPQPLHHHYLILLPIHYLLLTPIHQHHHFIKHLSHYQHISHLYLITHP